MKMATIDYCSGNIHMLQCLYLKCASKSMCKLVKSKNNFPHPAGSWCRALLLPCLSPQQGGERLYVQPDECILEQVRNWWQVHKSLIAVPMLVLERLPWLQRLTVCHCKCARTIRQVTLCTTSALKLLLSHTSGFEKNEHRFSLSYHRKCIIMVIITYI